MIDMKKEAKMWRERGATLLQNLSPEEQEAYKMITGWRDMTGDPDYKKDRMPDHEESCSFEDMTED